MPKPQIGARVDERLNDKIEEIIEEEDMSSRSEAARFLIERGVRDWEETGTQTAQSGIVTTLATQFAAVLAALAFVIAVSTAFGLVGYYAGIGVASTLLAPAMLIVIGTYFGFFRAIDKRLSDDSQRISSGVTEP